ncbi:MAG: hypothetical protein E6I65_07935 [Chloroflexi bacterium]|nr:MAG: hypothetical protein E6I65_07935 [Chloroflexota bacterium]
MTAIVLPDVDKSTIEELRKRIPDLSEIELPNLPSMKKVSQATDQTIDRLLGRSRASVWPWIAAGIGLVAVIGVVAAWFAWFRRPTWQAESDSWSDSADESTIPPTMTTSSTSLGEADDLGLKPVMDEPRTKASSTKSSRAGAGLTAAESSLGSTPYPIEEA